MCTAWRKKLNFRKGKKENFTFILPDFGVVVPWVSLISGCTSIPHSTQKYLFLARCSFGKEGKKILLL
jgi:hypothetical protein